MGCALDLHQKKENRVFLKEYLISGDTWYDGFVITSEVIHEGI